MNVSKWNSYRLAVLMSYQFPNGFGLGEWHNMIKEHLGTDRRTVDKYVEIMKHNHYVVKKDGLKFGVNPKIDDLKPKSLSELIREKRQHPH